MKSTYLPGESISLVDIVVFTRLFGFYKYVLDATIRDRFGNLTSLFNRILHQQNVLNFQFQNEAIGSKQY